MEKILVTTDEFNGRYVATKSFDDPTESFEFLVKR